MKLLIENFKRFIFEASEADYTDNLVRMLGHESEAIRDQGRELFLTLGLDYLKGKDLSGKNLENANLSGANLIRTNLSGANLKNANLRGADVRQADLRGVDFETATLANTIGFENSKLASLAKDNVPETDLAITDENTYLKMTLMPNGKMNWAKEKWSASKYFEMN